MSNEEFAPGPWRISEYEENKGKVYDYDGDLIATCTIGQSEYLANANLIAAAPDMYQALRTLAVDLHLDPFNDRDMGILDMIEAALSKAKGIIFIFAVLLISSCSRSVYSSTENNITVNGRIRQGIHIETVSVRRTTPNKL